MPTSAARRRACACTCSANSRRLDGNQPDCHSFHDSSGFHGRTAGTRAAQTSLVTNPRVSVAPMSAPAIGQLAALVGDVVTQLEAPGSGAPLHHMVAECNAVLEGCLEAQRDGRDREDRDTSPTDELRRLARLLTVAD